MNTNDKKMGWLLQSLEYWARIIAWLGALVLLATAVREIVQDTNSIFNEIILWIFFSATVVAGFFKILQFPKRN